MSLLPAQSVEVVEEPSKTWRLDLAAGRIRGMTDGLDAVVQAAQMAILTPRYRTLIYSWQYGSELETLLGRDREYVLSEAKRMISEALSADSRILGVRNFEVQNDVLRFTIDTIYGGAAMETEVPV